MDGLEKKKKENKKARFGNVGAIKFFNKIYMLRSISKLRHLYPDYNLKDQPKEYKRANSPYLSRCPEDV